MPTFSDEPGILLPRRQFLPNNNQALWRGKVAREDYEKKMDELEAAEITNMAVSLEMGTLGCCLSIPRVR